MLFTVTKNKVELAEQEPVNQGEYKATVLTFDFVSAYNGLTKKAIIKSNVSDKSYEVPVIDGQCDIPAEILAQKGTATVGVYGYEVEGDNLVLRYSPSPASFKVIDGSYTEDVENPSDVTPSQAAIYEAQIQKKIDEVDAVVEDVEEKRDSGAFDGKDGKDGKDGADGKDGKDGAAATISVGTTTTLEAGSDATVENTGSTSAAVFNFGIPRGADGKDGKDGKNGADGQDGADGQAATIAVGTVSTLTPGSNATVQNAGTSSAAVFNFGIPQGAKGDPGQNGQDGQDGQDGAAATIAVGTVSTLTPGSNATVTNAGTSSAAVFNFGIPQGAKGDPGNDGSDGQDATITVGSTAVNFGQSTSSVVITNSGTASAAVLNFTFNFAFADGNNISY